MGSETKQESILGAVTPSLFYGERLPEHGTYVWAEDADEAVALIRTGHRVVSDSPDTILFALTQLGSPLADARAAVKRAMFGLPDFKELPLAHQG